MEASELEYARLSPLQKAIVRHAHPVSFIVHLLALLWGGLFLWDHNWVLAVALFVLVTLVGEAIGWLDQSYLAIARSRLNLFQRLLVYHADLRNLIFHLIAFALYLYGCWVHSAALLLGSLSFALVGHIFPWLRHARSESIKMRAINGDSSSP